MLYIFDADGTLRRCTVLGQPCPNRPDEWELLPGVQKKLATIDWSSNRFAIASNQGGVALGFLTLQAAADMLHETASAAMELCASGADPIIAICPHAHASRCACRKPAPGLISELMVLAATTAEETVFIGDQESDREAAERAGVRFAWAKDFFG